MNTDKKNKYILILLFVGVLMGALDISIVGPAIPSIEKTMNVGERDLSWIFSIYVLFNLVGISLMAKLSDAFGRRLIYVISVAIFGIGSMVVSVSHDVTWLLIGRAIQGFGSSGIFPVAAAVVGDVFPVEKRGSALGLIGAVFGIAFILGPFIAGFMLLYFDWNSLFLINIPIAILLIIFALRLLPSARTEQGPDIDWAGIIMMAVILTSFTLALNNLDTRHLTNSLGSWTVLPLLMLTVLLTPILLMLEKHQAEPVINVRLFDSVQIRIVGFIALFLFSYLTKSMVMFYTAGAFLGFGLAMRASLNYVMLNEVSAKERASTQGVLLIFISIGQLAGSALIGTIAAATPGKPTGFGLAFLVMTVLSAILLFLAFFLKNRKQELEGNQFI